MRALANIGLLVFLVAAMAGWIVLPWWGAVLLAVLVALWLLLTRRGRQALQVAMVGISTLKARLGASAVIVVGIAGVVGVLVALLAMAEGYSQTIVGTGSNDTVLVLRGASASEISSNLDRNSVVQIAQTAGIVRDAKGEPLASDELVLAANVRPKGGSQGEWSSVQIRGVGETAWAVRPQVKVVEGRRFTPGLRELVVGRGALRQFEGLEIGKEIRLGANTWKVVGVFASGDALESELWSDAAVVADAYRRGSVRSSVTVRLPDAKAVDAFKAALAANPQLKVDATTTLEYYGRQSEGITKIIRGVGIVVGTIMAIGAMFGALNTMFAAVAQRAREIATLRAIGFPGLPVVVAVMLETMLLALLGGLLGGLVAYLLFNGHAASTLSQTSKVAFELRVTPELLWTGLKWALAIGFIGGLFPAVRAARLPVTTALREL